MQVKIVGVKRSEYTGKDGKDKTAINYFGLKDFTNYEKDNSDCEGVCAIAEYSSTDYGVHVGDIVEFMYEPGFKDKATLVDIIPIKIADKPPFKENAADQAANGQKTADSKPEEQKTK